MYRLLENPPLLLFTTGFGFPSHASRLPYEREHVSLLSFLLPASQLRSLKPRKGMSIDAKTPTRKQNNPHTHTHRASTYASLTHPRGERRSTVPIYWQTLFIPISPRVQIRLTCPGETTTSLFLSTPLHSGHHPVLPTPCARATLTRANHCSSPREITHRRHWTVSFTVSPQPLSHCTPVASQAISQSLAHSCHQREATPPPIANLPSFSNPPALPGTRSPGTSVRLFPADCLCFLSSAHSNNKGCHL